MRRSIGSRPCEEPLRVAREVERGDRRPVVGPDDPAAAVDEREALEPDGLARTGVMPTSTAVPPGGSAAIACSIVTGSPIASNTKSGPPSPAASRIPSTVAAGFGRVGLDPVRRPERAREVDLRPARVHRDDPARAREHGAHDARQADAAEADDRDGRARGHVGGLDARPRRPSTPPQPMSAATSGGTPSGIGTTAVAGHDLRRGHRPDRAGRRAPASRPAATRRVVPSACAWRIDGEPVHSHWRPRWHSRQRRHGAYQRQRDRPPDDAPGRAPSPTASIDARALVAHDDRARPLPLAVADVEVASGRRPTRSSGRGPRPAAGRPAAASRWSGARPARSMTAASISRIACLPSARGRACPIRARRLPRVLEPGGDPVDRRPDDVPDRAASSRGAQAGVAQPPEQLHLDRRQRVDVRVAQLDRAGERRVAGEEPVAPVTSSSSRTERAYSASIMARIAVASAPAARSAYRRNVPRSAFASDSSALSRTEAKNGQRR